MFAVIFFSSYFFFLLITCNEFVVEVLVTMSVRRGKRNKGAHNTSGSLTENWPFFYFNMCLLFYVHLIFPIGFNQFFEGEKETLGIILYHYS